MDALPTVAAIGRDPDALERFYREHVEAVQRFVARRVTSPHDAADLTADVFLAAVGSCGRYRASSGPPRAWLFGIARNVVAMHHRSSRRAMQASHRISGRALLTDDALERIAERIDDEREGRRLHAALSDLPASQQALVELVAVDGLPLVEAAAALGITPGNARVRYHRARRALTTALPTPCEVQS
ncbi:RNA polymerase sigma factor [Nocardioides euryhalodurans]|uniref:RNA polymerase sigma factor n=1 Tax=Nocardioides euryhalodurans TaxID=2518370 RepID=A0A4P7GPU4_9ACTN|nr:RNA polymerase sigma factor [Nocardioides euryhalodurans]QBR94039.1 RNA polymerase sigma factor [Nocardioides euryhalodurans]